MLLWIHMYNNNSTWTCYERSWLYFFKKDDDGDGFVLSKGVVECFGKYVQ